MLINDSNFFGYLEENYVSVICIVVAIILFIITKIITKYILVPQ